MNLTDWYNIEEFINVAKGQMVMCDEILTGRGEDDALQRLYTALGISKVKDALNGLDVEVKAFISEFQVLTQEWRVKNPDGPGLHLVWGPEGHQDRIFSGDDGHTYWLSDGCWVGAATDLDGSVDSDDGLDIDDFDLEYGDRVKLKARLTSFWEKYGPRDAKKSGACIHPCPDAFFVGEEHEGTGHWRCAHPLHWPESNP